MVKRLTLFLVLCALVVLTLVGCRERTRIETRDATEITGTSARLNGTLNILGADPNNDVCFWWSVASDPANPGEPAHDTMWTDYQTMTSTGDFSVVISGLVPGTRYAFETFCGERGLTVREDQYGEVKHFTTTQSVETPGATQSIETLDATFISSLFATLNGELHDLGGASSVEVYFQWGESHGSYTHETPKQTMTSPGRFSAQITGPMMIGNTYYFRAKAGATAQGSEKSFYVP